MTVDPAKSIPAFYAGQSIFLTGATGFLGKVFIEKVLRSCPDVREIFLLIRPRKGLNVNHRLEEILNLPLFDKLRNERPSNFEKLIPISGDVSKKMLGLSDEDKQMLTERVTIVIHGAANVRFSNSLKFAILTSTRSTRDICILAQSMKNLIALLYIGTAFAIPNEPFIEEKVYPPMADWKKMIEIVESLDDEPALNIFTAKFLDYAPNTYIFAKNLSESIIQDYSSSLPCAIVRPAQITASIKEPVPGWIDNVYGPIGLCIGCAKGVIRVCYLNKYSHENIVPVDIVIKSMLVLCWKLGLTKFTAGSTLCILNCVNEKGTIYQVNKKILLNLVDEIPFEGRIWTPQMTHTNNFVLFYILTILLHLLPAILIDLILKCFGRRPMLLQMVKLLYVANCAVSYFTFHDWKYCNTNKSFLMSLIPPEDQDTFSFDYSNLDLKDYGMNCIIGAKRFLLHEDINRLDAVKACNKRMDLFAAMMKTIICFGILYIIYKWI